jgi:hypothetical protein
MQATIVFTVVTLTGSCLTLLVTLTLIVIIGRHLRREHDVSLLLILNTYVTILAFSVVLSSTTITVLRADLYGVELLNNLDMAGCRFQGFVLYGIFCCCYMSFVLQALYRLIRVIHAKHKYLQVCVCPSIARSPRIE